MIFQFLVSDFLSVVSKIFCHSIIGISLSYDWGKFGLWIQTLEFQAIGALTNITTTIDKTPPQVETLIYTPRPSRK